MSESETFSDLSQSCDSVNKEKPPTLEDLATMRFASCSSLRSPRTPDQQSEARASVHRANQLTSSLSLSSEGSTEDLSPLSSQDITPRVQVQKSDSRKRPQLDDDQSTMQKKWKGNDESCDGEPQENESERSGIDASTSSLLHPDSNTLISYDIIRKHIEQQVQVIVASRFEALQTKMNKNVEEKMKQLLEDIRGNGTTKKGLTGFFKNVFSSQD